MDTRKIVTGVVVGIAVVFGVLAFKAPTVVTVEKLSQASAPIVNVPAPVVTVPAPIVHVAAPNVTVNPTVSIPQPSETTVISDQPVRLGALSSPDLPYNYFSFGGVRRFAGQTSFIQSSSTLCAIQGPAATSTMFLGGIRFAVSSSTAQIVEMAKASSAFATTTLINPKFNLAAGAQATIMASSTGSQAGDAVLFGPNDWFVIKTGGAVKGASALGNLQQGVCQATWQVI